METRGPVTTLRDVSSRSRGLFSLRLSRETLLLFLLFQPHAYHVSVGYVFHYLRL